ncbi:MAG: HAD family hydrolase [Magnetococcales bacterium]|nr:HAD family hydrolase [Magnetococcales bacterium]
MNHLRLETLPWLLPAPGDFSKRCKDALLVPAVEQAERFRELAGYALDLDALTRLARSLRKARASRNAETDSVIRLGLLGNATTGLLVDAIESTAWRYGLDLEVVAADFGQVEQAVMDPDAPLIQAPPEVVLLALDHRGLGFPMDFKDQDSSMHGEDVCGRALARINEIRRRLHEAGSSTVIVQNVPFPAETLFGALDLRIGTTLRSRIDRFNRMLLEALDDGADLLLDVAGLASSLGLDRWHDPVLWNQGKIPFCLEFVPLYADHLLRLLAALKGKSRKCLVLDLDHTLWGGVIGEDGMDGIVLGEGTPLGEAYLAVQRMALNLSRRGVVLAVCSKNTLEVAKQPFQSHPEMLLTLEDVAIFMANWQEKADNLQAMATQLNLGLDAFVFLDDNPVERAGMRNRLPMVAVPELPADPSHYPRIVLGAGYFEAVHFTRDDRQRTAQYRANTERAQQQSRFQNLDAFLVSLEMKLAWGHFDPIHRGRITQLVNKTNQFNLTTKRYTESQIEAMASDKNRFCLQARLTDRHGDNGIITVVVVEKRKKCWVVDSWLMSCRVMNRRVEDAVFHILVEQARRLGAELIEGRFVPTGRNQPVENHYQRLGFKPVSREGETSVWHFSVHTHKETILPMSITGPG